MYNVVPVNKHLIPVTSSKPFPFFHSQPVLCEILITLVEYSKTSMFMWMLVEGLYDMTTVYYTICTVEYTCLVSIVNLLLYYTKYNIYLLI